MATLVSLVLNIVVVLTALALLVWCTLAWLGAAKRRTMLIYDRAATATVRAVIGDWFGFVFAALSIVALATAVANIDWRINLWKQGTAVAIWFFCSVFWSVMGLLFLVLANAARTLLLAQAAQLERERAMIDGLRLAANLPDDPLQRRLYVVLSLHLCGVQGANSAVTQIEPRGWRAACCTPPIVVPHWGGRRRLLRHC